MRIYFELENFQEMVIEHNGASYPYSQLVPLAKKSRMATNISEYVYKLPTGKFIYLTVVGDEDQTSAYGIHKGWYVVEEISEEEAQFDINALSKFTALYS